MGVFIQELSFRNFRNFQNPTSIRFNTPLTVLVGKNSCGKSSILELIQRHAYNRIEDNWSVKAKVCDSFEPPGWAFNSRLGIPVFKLRSTRGVDEEIIPGRRREENDIDFVSLLKHRGVSNEHIERLNTYTKDLFGFVLVADSFNRDRWYADYGDKTVEVNLLSAGIQSMLALEIMLLISQNYEKFILLIEELENFLHPSKLRYYVNKLKKASEHDRLQIILTTHSPTVLSLVDISSIVRINQKGEVYQLMESDDSLKREWEKLIDPLKSETFFADRSVIYEGITDKMIIEGALRSEPYFDYMPEDVVSIKLDGVKHIKGVTEILRRFNIPYLCIVDSDRDSPIEEDRSEEFITMRNPYGEIEDAIPVEDFVSVAFEEDGDASMWLLFNLLNSEDFDRFSDLVARSFGKNKLSYAYLLGNLYSNMTSEDLKKRGIYPLKETVKSFIRTGGVPEWEIMPEVKKDIDGRIVLIVEDTLFNSPEGLIQTLEDEELFPSKVLPFKLRRSSYGRFVKRWLPTLHRSGIKFLVIVGEDFNFHALTRGGDLGDISFTDEQAQIKDSLILKRDSIRPEDIIELIRQFFD